MQKEESKKEPIETVECDTTYMVMYRHYMMPGGIFTYGSVEIDDYYTEFEIADKAAKKLFEKMKGGPDLHVWITRCIKTYCNGGVAIDKDIRKLIR